MGLEVTKALSHAGVIDVDIAVVGGGITGLTATHRLSRAHPRAGVVLLEASSRLGGKIRSHAFPDGHHFDTGPDAMLDTEAATTFCADLGLEAEVVTPGRTGSGIWSRGRVVPLPPGLVGGVPLHPIAVARSGILSPLGLMRAAGDAVLPRHKHGDVSVADLVGRRLGREVLERLVDPLVSGIYAGDTRHLSARVVTPTLYTAEERHRSLILGLRRRGPASGAAAGTKLVTLAPGGLRQLADTVAAQLDGKVDIRCEDPVKSIERDGEGRWLLHGRTATWRARGVILTVPSHCAANLLENLDADSATQLRGIEYASVAIITFAYPTAALPTLPKLPGFLVPRKAGSLVTAITVLSERWQHHHLDGAHLVRCSVGRHGDSRGLDYTDADLVAHVQQELGGFIGISGEPRQVHVARWNQGLPQYTVGHLDRVGTARRRLGEGIWLAGAAYDGMGVASCISQGRRAAEAAASKFLVPTPATAVGVAP